MALGDFRLVVPDITQNDVRTMSNEKFKKLLTDIISLQRHDRKENQLLYYHPASERTIDFHKSQAQTRGIFGGNRCLPLDAPILMADGAFKPLSDVKPGDWVIGANPETGLAEPTRVVKTWRSGVKPVYRVTFSDGGSFEASEDHRIPMYLGSGGKTTKGHIKKPHKRRLGDYIEPINRRGKGNAAKRIACVSPLDIQFNERLPLTLERKQIANSVREVNYRRRVCRTAEYVGDKECGDITVEHPSHCYVAGDYVIVSNSSKTESCLAEICALATGMLPDSVRDLLKPKFRGPINVRIVMESLTTVMHPIMLPKMKWWRWTGIDEPGGERGHWGWIPKLCLINGSWDRSWSEKLRTLTILCRDPDNPDQILGESQIQCMSFDQDPSDFASGTFHIVMHDEPPPYSIWRENQARTLDVNGMNLLAMTWPDDPSIPVDWIYDEVYEPGRPGANKDPTIDCFDLYTTDNRHLDPEAVRAKAASWTEETRKVRLYGQPIRFSNRIHPLFTDYPSTWCFKCGKTIIADHGRCPTCLGEDVVDYCHVTEFEVSHNWPTIFLLDPHPRKPHMFMWVQVDPSDDLWVVQEGQIDNDPGEVALEVFQTEESMGLNVPLRIIDPNMGKSPASAKRGITWQQEFDDAGLNCDLADDSDVGRGRINEFLRPDVYRLQPRLHFHSRCHATVHMMKRYSWDEHKMRLERDIKQKPRPRYDDYPTLLKYLLNYQPRFSWLHNGAPVVQRSGKRRGSY